MAIGPFKAGEIIRIPLSVTLDGKAIAVANARVQRLILPDHTDAPGYPATMTTAEPGVYYLERQLLMIGNYTAIIRYSKGTDISAACGQLSAKKIS